MTLTAERKRELTAQYGASEHDTGNTKVQIAQFDPHDPKPAGAA